MKTIWTAIKELHKDDPWIFMIPMMIITMFGLVPIRKLDLITENQAMYALIFIPLGFALFAIFRLIRLRTKK